MKRPWIVATPTPESISRLVSATGVDRVTAAVLVNRHLGDPDAAAGFLEEHPSVDRVEKDGTVLVATLCAGVEDYSDLPSALIHAGHKLAMFREEEVNLESAFMALTKGMGEKI